jgi:hypothetical protein
MWLPSRVHGGAGGLQGGIRVVSYFEVLYGSLRAAAAAVVLLLSLLLLLLLLTGCCIMANCLELSCSGMPVLLMFIRRHVCTSNAVFPIQWECGVLPLRCF